jgi:hypothetical protein
MESCTNRVTLLGEYHLAVHTRLAEIPTHPRSRTAAPSLWATPPLCIHGFPQLFARGPGLQACGRETDRRRWILLVRRSRCRTNVFVELRTTLFYQRFCTVFIRTMLEPRCCIFFHWPRLTAIQGLQSNPGILVPVDPADVPARHSLQQVEPRSTAGGSNRTRITCKHLDVCVRSPL